MVLEVLDFVNFFLIHYKLWEYQNFYFGYSKWSRRCRLIQPPSLLQATSMTLAWAETSLESKLAKRMYGKNLYLLLTTAIHPSHTGLIYLLLSPKKFVIIICIDWVPEKCQNNSKISESSSSADNCVKKYEKSVHGLTDSFSEKLKL